METQRREFEVDRLQVSQYFYWAHVLTLCLLGVMSFGVGLLAAGAYVLWIGKWLPKMQSDALHYWLDGKTLRVDQGVYFLRQKAIPLDRITDLMLSQGPVLRHFGLWRLSVQTAGAGSQIAEAILWGVRDPELVRNELLAARDQSVLDRS